MELNPKETVYICAGNDCKLVYTKEEIEQDTEPTLDPKYRKWMCQNCGSYRFYVADVTLVNQQYLQLVTDNDKLQTK